MITMKNVIIFSLLFLFLTTNAFASRLTIDQDYGWVTDWYENKYVEGNDLYVNSLLVLRLHPTFLNYSDNYTLEFSPWEPFYTKEPEFFQVRVYRDDTGVTYPIIKEKNYEKLDQLTNDEYSVIPAKQYDNWEQKSRLIVIKDKPTKSARYDILINYKLKDAIGSKGDLYNIKLDRHCFNYGKQENKCPKGNAATEWVFFDKNYRVEKAPSFAEIDEYIRGIQYVYVEDNQKYDVWFSDITETEVKKPLFWSTYSAVIGAIMGAIITLVIQNFMKIKKFGQRIYKIILIRLTWSKEERKKSKDLIKKYQLPKDIIGVKKVIFVKNVKRKRRK